jgi:hypothetical protein
MNGDLEFQDSRVRKSEPKPRISSEHARQIIQLSEMVGKERNLGIYPPQDGWERLKEPPQDAP